MTPNLDIDDMEITEAQLRLLVNRGFETAPLAQAILEATENDERSAVSQSTAVGD